MPSDLRADLALVAALIFAAQPALAAQPRYSWLCTASGPTRTPGRAPETPMGCHACTLCARPDEESEERG